VYGREIEGHVHTFGVSGKLIMNALVMYDHETRTLWSQFLGKGVKGPLAGVDLKAVPVTQTTWSAWKELHPDTLALKKFGIGRDSYSGYYRSDSAGVLGESVADDRLDRKELVLGVKVGGATKAYAFHALAAQRVVNDSVGQQDILVFFDNATDTGLAYDRTVAGRTLTFRMVGGPAGVHTVLVDEETGSRWQAFTGRAIEGQLRGETLGRVKSHLSFWFAWKDWNRQTELYTG
jgi:hypothetical protein